ncbi:MAG: hypothetical protein PHE83_03780 [Opitutaceae bacterium]|nr:hypothetical protein [Opitutaceae bacterium]
MKSIGEAFPASHSSESDGWRADPNYHLENFKIINALTSEEYR